MTQPTVSSSITVAAVAESIMTIVNGIVGMYGKTINGDVKDAIVFLLIVTIHLIVHVEAWGFKKTAEDLDAEFHTTNESATGTVYTNSAQPSAQ